MYATDEPVHLAKILKVGIQSENEKCSLEGNHTLSQMGGSVTKASRKSSHKHKYKLIDLNKTLKHGQLPLSTTHKNWANSFKARFTKSPKTWAPKNKTKKDGNIFLGSRFRRQLQHRRTRGHSQGRQFQQQKIERPRQQPFLYQPPPGRASPSPPQKGAL